MLARGLNGTVGLVSKGGVLRELARKAIAEVSSPCKK